MLLASRLASTASMVAPLRSRATMTGICSLDRPRAGNRLAGDQRLVRPAPGVKQPASGVPVTGLKVLAQVAQR